MINVDKLTKHINDLQSLLPNYIFQRLLCLLSDYSDDNTFYYFFYHIHEIAMQHESGIQYLLEENDNEHTITPVVELLDLLDGYIIHTEFMWTENQIPGWTIYVLEEGAK